MNPIAGMVNRRREGRGRIPGLFSWTSESDDHALARRMRTAAVQLHVNGRARLQLPRTFHRTLQTKVAVLKGLRSGDEGDGLVELLLQDARLIEACAAQASMDTVRDLPAVGRSTRIACVVEALCGGGDVRLTRDRLLLAIASFDDVQPLEMAELWAVPEAVRISTVHAWLSTCMLAEEIARERLLAERWTAGEIMHLDRRTPAFFERALQLLQEQENPKLYDQLEQYAVRKERSLDQLVHEAHKRASVVRMRLENLVANKRFIDSVEWRKCFEKLSPVEAELQYDPLGTYAAMDEQSRTVVRTEVARIARYTKLTELTIARHAVSAASNAQREQAPEAHHTVCYWLCDDDGRSAFLRIIGIDAVLPKRVLDPSGRRTAWGIVVAALVAILLYLLVAERWWTVIYVVPLAWCVGMALVGKLFPYFVSPARLLRLEMKRISDDSRTLVVLPVLLSSEDRAREMCAQMESLGCLERDKNLQYLILGDFADAEAEEMPSDVQIANAVRTRIAEMNTRAGWTKYFYLHRPRKLLEADQRWMGRDRKRGALMDLNRLLMGMTGAEEAFSVEGVACAQLRQRFAYVLTIDADTRFLPGTPQRLIGTMAHPLNRPRVEDGKYKGYGVLQPQMEMSPRACNSVFVRLFAGNGGVNAYPTSVSNLWQDLTGTGIFGGKGLYDVRAFVETLEGILPEGRVLSHDLIEGTLAGAALVSDVKFYDGYPSTLGSVLRRMHRWTRGDWQLLPMLFARKRFSPNGKPLGMAARIRLLDNLLRSLYAPALLTLLVYSAWFGDTNAMLTGLLVAFWSPILNFMNRDKLKWRRALAEMAILPLVASTAMDAILRTLWRIFVSGKHLLDWVPSADVEGARGRSLACGVFAILMLPGVFMPSVLPAVVAIAALFAVAPGWIRDMEDMPIHPQERLTEEQTTLLRELACDIWRFFEAYVSKDDNYLPPDNVQIDPATGTARRTSPTNIGLYLMSCVSAATMGFLSQEAALDRLTDTVATLERIEKWHGHLYNWYDIDTLNPLRPKYVSSVDSGNLAAALLLCASAIEEVNEEMPRTLAKRMRALAKGMDFVALYDRDRGLFAIGADVEHERISQSYYDLLASESRILSFTAMMLGQVPLKHWSKLSRAAVAVGKKAALISWSGTMFEYLMPELFMDVPENTLLGESVRAAVSAQRALGRRRGRPWGVSESGYYAFDLHLNYQYRAFGLRALSLGGNSPEDVVAPYASIMAVGLAPGAVVENIMAMESAGWRGEFGFYEAADYLNAQKDMQPRLVRSYMAHHQGMALCALCNALSGRALIRAFMRIPEAMALSLMLEERTLESVPLLSNPEKSMEFQRIPMRARDDRLAQPKQRIVDAHLLGGGGATALLTADGAVHYQHHEIYATRFSGDLLNRQDGACVHVWTESAGDTVFGAQGQINYAPGRATYNMRHGTIKCEMTVCISPEDGAFIRNISLENITEKDETVRVIDCVPVALCREADMRAHPVFGQLFVESRRISACALAFSRRPREKDEEFAQLVHLVNTPGTISCETSYEKLVGRMGSVMRPGGICEELSGTVGTVLNPCSALEAVMTVPAGKRIELHFAMGITESQKVTEWIERNFAETVCERAVQLATMQAQAMLGFLGLEPRRHHLLQRMAALFADGRLTSDRDSVRAEAMPVERNALWTMGISGDWPILLVRVDAPEALKLAREAIRVHEFYRALGVKVDLVFIDEQGNDYDRPVRDALGDMIALSPLNELRGVAGGVHLVESSRLEKVHREALERVAVVTFTRKQDFYSQVRQALSALDALESSVTTMNLGENRLAPMRAKECNGYGSFLADGRYAIDVQPDHTTPAPWSNLLANDRFGVLLTERGGGFLWNDNSRNGRLTAFANDALHEGWGWMFYLVDTQRDETVRLLPGNIPNMPFRTTFGPGETVYRFETERLSGEIALCVREDASELRIRSTLRAPEEGSYQLVGFVDWLMGTDALDTRFVRTWMRDGAGFAVGAMPGVGYFACADARVSGGCSRNTFLGRGGIQQPEGLNCKLRSGGWVLHVPLTLHANQPKRTDWVIGWADGAQNAYARVRSFYAQPDWEKIREQTVEAWRERLNRMVIETPDMAVNRMANGWLIHQVLTCRVRARTGLYQPGGAYGFRDQLQDMLALLPFEPKYVRAHILRCAARQFEDGDVMHWWHEPFSGVRTKISDDLLFLPYVTAQYVRWTQDTGILKEAIPYLENVEIEAEKEDRYCDMRPGNVTGTLHDHCMRAFRRVVSLGEHGLVHIGTGDWNDGMNRVGAEGRGESIWLSEFLAVCATDYAVIALDEADRTWLNALSAQMNAAVEEHGWDGNWYLRAYTDDGEKLGSAQGNTCRIDAISQAWAVMAQLDVARCAKAMDAVWEMLTDEQTGIIRLLTPPFRLDDADPGYIRGYPEGVRENGAQYTHAACWVLLALIRSGEAARAHRALQMLLPENHANTFEQANLYRVEPYVLAADIYDGAYAGRGGWTWYTGSASWLYRCILEIVGFSREGNRVKLNALLGNWPEVAVTVKFGTAKYRLISRKNVMGVTLDGTKTEGEWIHMQDDGTMHEAVFPARNKY